MRPMADPALADAAVAADSQWKRLSEGPGLKTYQIKDALEACEEIGWYQKEEVIRRFEWAVDSYVESWISRERALAEAAWFRHQAARLIAEEEVLYALKRAADDTETSRQRRRQWLEQEAQARVQEEFRHQRSRLWEGRQTLAEIRKMVRPEAPRLRRRASEPAMSSQTS